MKISVNAGMDVSFCLFSLFFSLLPRMHYALSLFSLAVIHTQIMISKRVFSVEEWGYM